MGKVFLKPQEATSFKLPAGQTLKGLTLADLLNNEPYKGQFAGLTYEDIALFNWGTTVKEEVNRALIELVGCSDVDPPNDPRNSKLDPARGTGQPILIPKLYAPRVPSDKLEQTYKISVKRRLPAPAVAITKLDPSFVPKSGGCNIEYDLEGGTARADRVDVEVHVDADRYFKPVVPAKPEPAYEISTTNNDKDLPCLLKKLENNKVVPEAAPRTSPYHSPPPFTWDGKSEATEGVLKKSGATDCYVNVPCSPYTVLVRYYRHDPGKVNKALITLKPFWPCWNSADDKNPAPQPIETSFKVDWEIKNDDGKLKIGQLLIWDKNDKPVFRAVLNEDKLRNVRSYDLLNDKDHKWDRATIKMDDMPYRVQIQAHSTIDEDNGLAVAVMPTSAKYEKIQFIAFNIRPDTVTISSVLTYLGDPDPDTDLRRRCEIMTDAIKEAYIHADVKKDDPSVLKVFMAPEFYFRGAAGAYPLDKISDIPETMRKETDQFIYADWLFVFGTAIGRLLHDEPDKKTGKGTGKGTRHGGGEPLNGEVVDILGTDKIVVDIPSRWEELSAVVGNQMPVIVKQATLDAISTKYAFDNPAKPANCRLTLKKKHLGSKFTRGKGPVVLTKPVAWILETSTAGGVTRIKVRSRLCSNITADPVRLHWRVKQGFSESEILKCIPEPAPNPQQDYWLTLKIEPKIKLLGFIKIMSTFVPGAVDLIEPEAVEVFNIALVQKGWPKPAPRRKELQSAVVYKEYVSWIDFLGPNYGDAAWNAAAGRLIQLDDSALSKPVLPVRPTEGSRDLLGLNPNDPTKAYAPTKGRSELTDKQGVKHRVGSEVNLSGIGGGSVFTIDGITFGLEICKDHLQSRLHIFYNGDSTVAPAIPPAATAAEPRVQVLLIPSWGASIGGGKICCVTNGLVFNVDGARHDSVARLYDGTTYSCDDHPEYQPGSIGLCPHTEHFVCVQCNKVKGDAPGNCPDHGTALVTYYKCAVSKEYYKAASHCTKHGALHPVCTPLPCNKSTQLLGAALQPNGTPIKVDPGDVTTYFQNSGRVLVYGVKPIPNAEFVP